MTQRTLIFLAGTVWLLIGVFLLLFGFYLVGAYDATNFVLIAMGVGYLKGRFVLGRSVRKQVARINALSAPALKHIYSKGYYFLIASMMALGMLLRFLPISPLLRGVIDIAIGVALIAGALQYYVATSKVRT